MPTAYTDWREFISALFSDAEFSPSATDAAMAALEREFDVQLPVDLRSLLANSDGVAADYGTAMVWSVREMSARNRMMRTEPGFDALYMPFNCLFFIGDDGSGDLFGYRILAGQVEDWGIYRWSHENDDRTWFAHDVRDYFQRCRPVD